MFARFIWTLGAGKQPGGEGSGRRASPRPRQRRQGPGLGVRAARRLSYRSAKRSRRGSSTMNRQEGVLAPTGRSLRPDPASAWCHIDCLLPHRHTTRQPVPHHTPAAASRRLAPGAVADFVQGGQCRRASRVHCLTHEQRLVASTDCRHQHAHTTTPPVQRRFGGRSPARG
jgi:hypothetical protein